MTAGAATHQCFVCGWDLGSDAPWGPDGSTPSGGTCPSCGCEFGLDDASRHWVEVWRARWIAEGCRWHDRSVAPPLGWNPSVQLGTALEFIDYDARGQPVRDPRFDRVERRVVVDGPAVDGEFLKGPAGARAIHATLGAVLTAHGLRKAGNKAYFRAVRDDVVLVAGVTRVAKFTYPGVASCVAFDVGLGTAPEPADPRLTAMRHLAFCLGDGDLVAAMCKTHNTITEGWRRWGPEAARVATLLSWTVRTDWRNAPDVLWFRTGRDLEIWAEFLTSALPPAISRLEGARLDRSGLSLSLYLDEQRSSP